MAIEIIEARLEDTAHQEAVLRLINTYAQDPMGDGRPLAPEVFHELIPGLRRHPTTLVFLAFQEGEAVGIAVCFYGFSTFAARPLINIHDFSVLPEARGFGIGPQILKAVEKKAVETGCCKITLEVQENNGTARKVYERAGFARSQYVEEAGEALFLSKKL